MRTVRTLLVFLLILYPPMVTRATHVPPAHDATTTTSVTFSAVQNPTVSHTRGGTCPNPVSFISVSWQDTTPATLTTVTSGGSGATALHNALNIGGGENIFLSAWIFKNPPSGASTVQANFSEVVNGAIIRVSTYCNVDQTTSTGTVATAGGSSTTPSVTVTSAVGEMVVDAAMTITGINFTVDGSQTERFSASVSGNHKMAGSEEAGEVTTTPMSWSLSGTALWGSIGVALKPAADAGGQPTVLRGGGIYGMGPNLTGRGGF